jgi:hypothetical protein
MTHEPHDRSGRMITSAVRRRVHVREPYRMFLKLLPLLAITVSAGRVLDQRILEQLVIGLIVLRRALAVAR